MSQKQDQIQQCKRAYVRGFTNQALLSEVDAETAKSMAKQACEFRETLHSGEVKERLEKRATQIADLIRKKIPKQ